MPGLKIPEEDRPGLALLRRIPDEVFQALLIEINRSPSSIPKVQSLSAEDAEQLFDSLNTLYRVHGHHDDIKLEEFISDICEALRGYNELSVEDEPGFRDRLWSALNIDALRIATKAFSLSGEHEHLFCTARVITDARPVFADNVSEGPAAMVITHNLKIEYHDVIGELNEIYIGLGSADITELRGVLDRAEEKAKSLRAALMAAKIKCIDPQQE